MQPHLTRSRTDTMIAGVCGGLAEYFSVDPIIVRLIFVVVTLTSGFGPPVYILLWILMPRQQSNATTPQPPAPYPASGQEHHPAQQPAIQQQRPAAPPHAAEAQQAMVSQPQPQTYPRHVVGVEAPVPPAQHPFLQKDYPSTGETIRLPTDNPSSAPVHYPPPAAPFQPQYGQQHGQPHQGGGHHKHHGHHSGRARNWHRLGVILIGMGTLVLINQLNINMAFIIPPLMILGGIILLRRNR